MQNLPPGVKIRERNPAVTLLGGVYRVWGRLGILFVLSPGDREAGVTGRKPPTPDYGAGPGSGPVLVDPRADLNTRFRDHGPGRDDLASRSRAAPVDDLYRVHPAWKPSVECSLDSIRVGSRFEAFRGDDLNELRLGHRL